MKTEFDIEPEPLEFNREFKLELYPNDRLGGRVPISNMLYQAKIGLINAEKLEDKFKKLIYNLNVAKELALTYIEKREACAHLEFKPTTYTHERRIMGYVRVYKRVCCNCTHTESFTIHDDEHELTIPDWALCATQVYFNNDAY